MPSPGPGNGCRPTISSGRPSSRPTLRTSSLNSSRSGSMSLNFMSGLEPADVVVRLDRDRRTAARRERLDHVGIQRSLHQELSASFPAPRRSPPRTRR